MHRFVQLLLLCAATRRSHAFAPSAALRQQQFRTTWMASTAQPLTEDSKLLKKVITPGTGEKLNLGDIATVQYTCYANSKVIARSPKQKMVVGDTAMIPAWDKALRSMSIGERAVIQVTDPALGYGAAGVTDVVPPNAVLELDLYVTSAQPATANIDFDSLAMADNTPRTASEIQAAFAARQALRANDVPKEGFEGFLEKAKNFYFFGLFEGETGERPPWFLRPSITFPIAFVVVGAAFYVTLLGGGIYERGAPVKDELDELIVNTETIQNSVWLATTLMMHRTIDLGL
ncbi:hypothetical protein FisN_21Hh233 [Fistulifera solaris]|uniref:peptidylprolyl isomerase n=1 Tax=Fistulifera solaris TaxID=1519565 RepID=A0A1Z5JRX9_FISSO|nr:hypothetical protein FisN_21Hh233 [Fistulifera solaris]|eukprot:GAX16785.1 hypothetical protein FisN_21Hh233 [Fistulifera solaris]